ncbi:MAG: tetratricopeptide repeat protein [Microscillaceae bacterium]|nr:tetratricopeptide repeat protein [Microscillaceae bacterium]MDW8461149.1 tetratricopeptide repeat protein [Cytophagales bacterium]
MEKEKFIYYLEHPSLIDQTDIELLEDLAIKYPFFHLAHTLIAKYTHEKESLLAPQKIRRAAVHLYDRDALRRFIHTEWRKDISQKVEQINVPETAFKVETSTFESTPSTYAFQSKESENTSKESELSFFDSLDTEEIFTEQPKESNEYTKTWNFEAETTSTKDINSSSTTQQDTQEEISETIAMDLFNEGKQEEAILMYKKLIKKYPGRKSYFQRQLAILTDDESYLSYGEEDEDEQIESKATLQESKVEVDTTSTPFIQPKEIEHKKDLETAISRISYELPAKPTTEHIETDYSSKLEINPHTQSTEKEVDKKYVSSFFDDIEDDYEAKPQPATILYESDAILLFNQGKTQEAIEIYEKLIKQNPEKRDYYLNQIHILKSFEKPTEPTSENKVENFFEKIDITPKAIDEDISEIDAISLFNQGKIDEAIEIYRKLILKYPEKRNYYNSQIEILKS